MDDQDSPGGAGASAGRNRARTTLVAAAVLVLLLGLATFVALGPGDGPTDGPTGAVPSPTRKVTDVDWRQVPHPVDCRELALRVLDVEVANLDGTPGPEAVVVVRCDAGAGSPPSAVLVYDQDSVTSRPPSPAATLLTTGEDVLLAGVSVDSGRIRGEAFAYSAKDVPRCCPDRHLELTWRWTGRDFRRQTRDIGG